MPRAAFKHSRRCIVGIFRLLQVVYNNCALARSLAERIDISRTVRLPHCHFLGGLSTTGRTAISLARGQSTPHGMMGVSICYQGLCRWSANPHGRPLAAAKFQGPISDNANCNHERYQQRKFKGPYRLTQPASTIDKRNSSADLWNSRR